MYVAEKPTDPDDVPTVTPGGHPIEPMVPLNADGTINTEPPKRCNPTQEMILVCAKPRTRSAHTHARANTGTPHAHEYATSLRVVSRCHRSTSTVLSW